MADRVLRVALAQVRTSSDVVGAVATVSAHLEQAAEHGAALVIFPEGVLGGYHGADFDHPDDLNGEAVEEGLVAIAAACAETGVGAAVGASRRAADGRLLNSLILLSRRGETLGQYVKTHLTGSDRLCYTPGGTLPILQFEGIPVGLQICYDQRFPEPWRQLALAGAQVVLHASNACEPGATWKIPVVEAHLRSRAAENGFFVASVNRGGPSQNWGSVVHDPHGLEVVHARYDCEELVSADLDLSRVTTDFLHERRTDLVVTSG